MAGTSRPQLPAPVAALLDGADLPTKIGQTLLLVACDSEGWPRMALLSVGEVLAPSLSEVRLALYPGSRTTQALRSQGRALLVVVLDGCTYKVELTAAEIPDAEPSSASFTCAVHTVVEDRVPYARIEQGVTFTLVDEAATLTRWARTTARLAELRP